VPKTAASSARLTITPAQYRAANRSYLRFAHRIRDQLDADHKHVTFDVNPVIALNVSVATYDDIDRYKAYHLRNARPGGGARSDSVKRAAYFTKWTAKLRPISFDPSAARPDPNDMALMANEILAASYALELIGSELNKHLRYSDKTYAELLYDLHYRDMTDGALSAWFQLIWDLAKSGQKNPVLEFAVN